jgi:hypothetical protein
MAAAMVETIHIEVPGRDIGVGLTEAFAEQGLRAEVVEDGAAWGLHVSFTDGERERLLVDATHAIETYLSTHMLPLIVQRAGGGCVVRPPAD